MSCLKMKCDCQTGNIIAVDDIVSANKQAVHVVDKDGATPLMFAAMRGHVEVCKRRWGLLHCCLVHFTRCVVHWWKLAVMWMLRTLGVAGPHSCRLSITGECGC